MPKISGDLRGVREWLLADQPTRELLAQQIDDQLFAEGGLELLRLAGTRIVELEKRAIAAKDSEEANELDGISDLIRKAIEHIVKIRSPAARGSAQLDSGDVKTLYEPITSRGGPNIPAYLTPGTPEFHADGEERLQRKFREEAEKSAQAANRQPSHRRGQRK